MIPAERVSIPTKFLSVPNHPAKQSLLDVVEVMSFLRRNQELDFSVNLNLNAICRVEKLFQVLSYQFQLNSGFEFNDEFIVNCDSRYIYVARNNWIPYNLRYWMPPILVNILKPVQVDEPIVTMRASDLILALETEDTRPVITLDDASALVVNSKKSSIDFVIQWNGIRYYLVNYYLTSLVLGTTSIWVMSSFFCLMSALVSLVYFSLETDTIIKKEEVDLS